MFNAVFLIYFTLAAEALRNLQIYDSTGVTIKYNEILLARERFTYFQLNEL